MRKIHNYIYANEGLGRQEAFDEIIKILLIKIFDEKERLNYFFVSKKEEREARTFVKRFSELQKYSGQEKVNLSTATLIYVVKSLQKQALMAERNLAGEVFQDFIANNQKAERGQFFTPTEVVKLAVKIIDPKPNEHVLDPACGGGGFLIETIEHLKGSHIRENISGMEINPRVAQIAKLGISLARGDEAKIQITNSLKESRRKIADVILANPPFGIKGRIREKSILDKYKLARGYKSMVPEIVFIEQCYNFLKPRGRMAIVLPNGVLESENNQFVREFVKNKFAVQQIVDLPEKTFSPYGTNVKTSLLILIKSGKSEGWVRFGRLKKGKIVETYRIRQKKINDRLDYQFNKPVKTKAGKIILLSEVAKIAPREVPLRGEEKVSYVEISGINARNMAIESVKKMSTKTLPKRAKYKLKKGDILVSLVGNYLGTRKQAVAIVDSEHDGAWCSDGFAVIRKSLIDRFYLLYFFKSEYFLRQMEKYKKQTTIPRVRLEDLLKTQIKILGETEMRDASDKVRKYFETTRRAQKIYKNAFDEV